MANAPLNVSASPGTSSQETYTVPLIIITILFFMWGFITCMNDILIPHLKSVYTLSYTQAMLVQLCFFGAYFFVSLPAGHLVHKIGYKSGAVVGLLIAAMGCALFYPASTTGYSLFLFALFVLASGITILQVAANPYVTILGPSETASSRLTLTQAFNSLGTTIAPLIGGAVILGGAVVLSVDQIAALSETQLAEYKAKEIATVQVPYLILAALLAALALFFALVRLPKVTPNESMEPATPPGQKPKSALSQPQLALGVIGIFLYVGAEVSIGSFLVNFIGESNIAGLPEAAAAKYVAYFWFGAMVGRFIGFAVMRKISPGLTLAFNCLCAIILILIATFSSGSLAMWSIILVGLFNSIMFPTIFSIALSRLGKLTSQGSGFLCMAIVGGALVPVLQGYLADTIGLQLSFLLPALCYVYILYFGVKFAKLHLSENQEK